MLLGSTILEELRVGVQEHLNIAAGMCRTTSKLGWRRRNSSREVGIPDHRHLRGSLGKSDCGVSASLQIYDGLLLALTPQVIEGDRIVGAIETPHPVAGERLVRGRRSLSHLHCVSKEGIGGRTHPQVVVLLVWMEEQGGPACPRVARRPSCPRSIAPRQGRLQVSTIRQPLVGVGQIHLDRCAVLLQVADASSFLRRLLCPSEYGKEDGCQDRDDRDDHQQLDEGEGAFHVPLRYAQSYALRFIARWRLTSRVESIRSKWLTQLRPFCLLA